jgi:hypothetical protein
VLKLPEGAEAAFRIVATDAFGGRFVINVYGAGRGGWFVATNRGTGFDRDSGVRQLPKGEWPTLLHLIDRCGFWSLSEDGSHLTDPTVTVDDGEWLSITGRNAAQFHRVRRFIWREPGLEAVLSFGRRVSGFFVRHPISGFWVPPAEPVVAPGHIDPNAESPAVAYPVSDNGSGSS